MASLLVFLFNSLVLSSISSVLAETGCPPQENITPCICEYKTTPRLECGNIVERDVLERVFKNAARYSFQEVHIRSTVLQYLPSVIFDGVGISELYIENSRLIGLFEKPPRTRTLEKLQLDNTTILRGFINNEVLKQVTSLKILIANGVPIPNLTPAFSNNFPSSLKQIILHRNGMKKILPGAFSHFSSLDKLDVSSNKLKNLTRSMLPPPHNLKFLYFDNNEISDIPHDFFLDMTELQLLSMRNNHITVLPESNFANRQGRFSYLNLDGNPLKCNCLSLWLVKSKPEIIAGTCYYPKNLEGKKLQDLRPGDFNC